MAFDGIFCLAVAEELNAWAGAKVEKLHQSSPSCMYFQLYKDGRHGNLMISASAARPELSVTENNIAHPETPTPMCMLFRKQLQNGRLEEVGCVGNERIAFFRFSSSDEMGYSRDRFIYAEMMGKYSNLILTDGDGKIICASAVTDITSPGRHILPGMQYEYPPKQDKVSLFRSESELISLCRAGIGSRADGYILKTFFALSPLAAREIAFAATGGIDSVIDEDNCAAIAASIARVRDMIVNRDFVPSAVFGSDGEGIEYSFMPIRQYGAGYCEKSYDSFSALLGDFYGRREEAANISRYSRSVVQTLNTNIARVKKKLLLLRNELSDCDSMDGMRACGDVITASIYRIKQGDASVKGMDYVSGDELEVKLEPNLSPAKNAQKYYKKYAKMKRASVAVAEQIKLSESEEDYLEGVLDFVSRASSPREIAEIRAELADGNYIRSEKQSGGKKKKTASSGPLCFVTKNGLSVRVGRNNRQNDALTGGASKNEIWFHIKGFHGSHVILTPMDGEPSDDDYTVSAMLAAYYSEKRGSRNVGVDYTRVKNLKKPNGSAPGFVTYDSYHTAVVDAVDPFSEEKTE